MKVLALDRGFAIIKGCLCSIARFSMMRALFVRWKNCRYDMHSENCLQRVHISPCHLSHIFFLDSKKGVKMCV
jgi:hypothetical protein